MINILQEEIKILHEKMLKAINSWWLHNDALEKNNSLNDCSNELQINVQRFVIGPVKQNLPSFNPLLPGVH